MKPTIETIHKITIKGQTFEMTTEELTELYNLVDAAIGFRSKDHAYENASLLLEEIRKRHNKDQQKPVVPLMPNNPSWGPLPLTCSTNETNTSV